MTTEDRCALRTDTTVVYERKPQLVSHGIQAEPSGPLVHTVRVCGVWRARQCPFGVRTAGSPAALRAKLALDARRPHASRKAAQRHCGGRRGATERARTLTCSARVAGMCVNGALQLAFCCTSTSCEHHSGGVSFGRRWSACIPPYLVFRTDSDSMKMIVRGVMELIRNCGP